MSIVDYKTIADYYSNIIHQILTICDNCNPCYWDNEKECMVYSEEYNDAYSYLQKAEWRISDIYTLKDYYCDDDFKYYGLEILQEVRHRIQHYLEDEDFDLSHLPEEVYNYKEYDDIIITYYNSIRKDNDFYEKWKYYYNLKHYVISKNGIVHNLEFVAERLNDINSRINNDYMNSEFNDLISDELKDELYYLYEMTNKAIGNVKAIDIEEKI